MVRRMTTSSTTRAAAAGAAPSTRDSLRSIGAHRAVRRAKGLAFFTVESGFFLGGKIGSGPSWRVSRREMVRPAVPRASLEVSSVIVFREASIESIFGVRVHVII